MWPTIVDGGLVEVVPLRRPLRKGEIVLMNWRGKPVLHRVRKIDAERVWTQGDSCIEPDPPTPLGEVVAVAIAVDQSGCRTPLRPSLDHGGRALLRYAALRGRLMLARSWRSVRAPLAT
jgi:hypothetical protein